MYEAEGFQEVDRALKKLFRDETRRPAVLYYDTACGYEEFLRKRKDQFWVGTQLVVDRYVRVVHTSVSLRTHERGSRAVGYSLVGAKCLFLENLPAFFPNTTKRSWPGQS